MTHFRQQRADRKTRTLRGVVGAAFTLSAWGCASVPTLSPVACERVNLAPAPPWTASAAWSAGQDELVLVDPGSRGFASYGRDGQRLREASLDGIEIDYSEPMRFERTGDGYVLVGKTQILRLDANLKLEHRQRPFATLKAGGVIDGSLNDAVLHDGALYGYADYIDAHQKPEGSPDAPGLWRRGFVRLDATAGKLHMLHELPLGDGGDSELASYYLYDRRPYVAELGDKVFVLRFTEPWTVHRVTRRGLREVASGAAGDGGQAQALQAWNGKLYLLTSRALPDPGAEPVAGTTAPVPIEPKVGMELIKALQSGAVYRHQWTLHEIDPRRGITRRIRLPTSAERIRLIPGQSFWTAIEETTSPSLGGDSDRTTFLYLPSAEIVAGAFSCADAAKPRPQRVATVTTRY